MLRHGVLLHAFVFKLKNRVHQHQDAQRQNARDHHGDGVDCRRDIVNGHHDVHVVKGQLAVSAVTLAAGALHVRLVAAHPVTQDGLGVSRFHRQLLVVELPVLFALVEICVV